MQKTANDLCDFSRRNQVGILGVHSTNCALDIFVSIFLVSRLLSMSDGNFSKVAFFYAVCWSGLMLTFWLFSYVVKKFSRVWCIRASTFGLLSSVILVLLLRDSLDQYYLILGAIYGLSLGIYWCSMHTFTSEALGGAKMSRYTALYVGITTFVRVVAPLTLGAIIEFVDFAAAAAIATGLAAVLLMFTLILRDNRKSQGKGFSMRAFFEHIRRENIARPIFLQFWIQAFFGILLLASVAITVLVALTFKDDFALGYFTSAFAAASIITLTCYKAIRSPRAKAFVLHILSALPLLGAIGLLFGLSPATVIMCQAGFLTFKTAADSEFERTRLNLMADFGAEHLHTEGLLFIELGYGMARTVGLGLLLLAYFSGTFYFFRVFIFALMCIMLIGIVLLQLWRRKYKLKS